MANEKSLGEWIGGLIGRSPEEKLLIQRRKKRRRYRAHLIAYMGMVSILWIVGLLEHGQLVPPLVTTLLWGIFLMIHTLNYREWQLENREAFQAAEHFVRTQGRASARYLAPPEPAPRLPAAPAKDPLLLQCKQAASQTRERLNGVGAGEVEALAVVDEGLQKVRELLAHRGEIAQALADAGAETLPAERARIEQRLRASQEAETRSLYQSQLELLESRAEKIRALAGLQERMTAYAESYLAALTNLRMDATRLKTMDLPQHIEMAQLMKPVKQIEQQVEGMRLAMQEVAQAMRTAGS